MLLIDAFGKIAKILIVNASVKDFHQFHFRSYSMVQYHLVVMGSESALTHGKFRLASDMTHLFTVSHKHDLSLMLTNVFLLPTHTVTTGGLLWMQTLISGVTVSYITCLSPPQPSPGDLLPLINVWHDSFK